MIGIEPSNSDLAVDVVIPTFNRKDALDRCLSALRSQTVPPRSITIIDDSEEDLGPAISRNKGWRKGSAEIVAFTDDDCVPMNNWIEKILLCFRENSVHVIEGSVTTEIDGKLSNMDPHPKDRWNRFKTANMAYRRVVLEYLDGFDERYYIHREDTDLAWRAIESGYNVKWAPDCIVHHPDRAGVERDRARSELLLYRLDRKKYHEIAAGMISIKKILNGDWAKKRFLLRTYEDTHVSPLTRYESMRLWSLSLFLAVMRKLGLR